MAEMVNGRFAVDASFPHPARAASRTSASWANALRKMVLLIGALVVLHVIEFIEDARSSVPGCFLGGVAGPSRSAEARTRADTVGRAHRGPPARGLGYRPGRAQRGRPVQPPGSPEGLSLRSLP